MRTKNDLYQIIEEMDARLEYCEEFQLDLKKKMAELWSALGASEQKVQKRLVEIEDALTEVEEFIYDFNPRGN